MNGDEQQAKYLADFDTFSPAKQHRHIAFMVRWLLGIMAEQERVNARRLNGDVIDGNAIDGECTVGGEA
jgi:hypothetical protein